MFIHLDMSYTTFQSPREKANKIFKTISNDLAPVIREHKLKECLRLYSESIDRSLNQDELSSSHKNMGVTFIRLFKLVYSK